MKLILARSKKRSRFSKAWNRPTQTMWLSSRRFGALYLVIWETIKTSYPRSKQCSLASKERLRLWPNPSVEQRLLCRLEATLLPESIRPSRQSWACLLRQSTTLRIFSASFRMSPSPLRLINLQSYNMPWLAGTDTHFEILAAKWAARPSPWLYIQNDSDIAT